MSNPLRCAIIGCGVIAPTHAESLLDDPDVELRWACDLVEEWRTFIVDRLVLGLMNSQSVGPDDFITRKQGDLDYVDEQDLKAKRPVELKPGPRKALVEAYEEWMNRKIRDPVNGDSTSHRQHILRQVRHFSAYLNSETDVYIPFPWSSIR